nr:hypothetical protein [Micromonospora sp. DSM 115978]
MSDVRDQAARLCQSLGLLRTVVPDGELDELVARVRAGKDVADRLTDLFRRSGLPEPAPQLRGSLAVGLPGASAGRFQPDGYVCPVELCSGWRRQRPGSRRPFCELARVDMRRLSA